MMVVTLFRKDPVSAAYWWTRIALALLRGLDAETLSHAMLSTLAMTPEPGVLS